MKKEHYWLLVGYLVGSFFGITDVLGMLKGAPHGKGA